MTRVVALLIALSIFVLAFAGIAGAENGTGPPVALYSAQPSVAVPAVVVAALTMFVVTLPLGYWLGESTHTIINKMRQAVGQLGHCARPECRPWSTAVAKRRLSDGGWAFSVS